MKYAKLLIVAAVFFLIGYKAHKVDLFPIGDFIERQFVEEVSETQLKYAVFSNLNNKLEVSCPTAKDTEVFAVFGQSNAANNGGHSFENTNPKILNFFNGKCYIASDPVLGASSGRGSLWIPFSRALKTDKYILLVPFAINSSLISHWLAEDGLWSFYKKVMTSLEAAGYVPSYFMWMQGESDRDLTKDEYMNDLGVFFGRIKEQYPNSKIAISGTSFCGVEAPQIVEAQKEFVDENNYIWLGETDKFIKLKYRYDRCHLSEQGMRAIAEMFADNIQKDLD